MAITKGVGVPSEWTAGDTIRWETTHDDHGADAGWSMTYFFRRSGSDAIEVKGTAGGAAEFDFEIGSDKSSLFKDGSWRWYLQVFKQGAADSEGRATIKSGTVLIQPDPAAADDEGWHAKMIGIYQGVLEKLAGRDFVETGAAGGLSFKSDAEVRDAINYHRAQLNALRAARAKTETGRSPFAGRTLIRP